MAPLPLRNCWFGEPVVVASTGEVAYLAVGIEVPCHIRIVEELGGASCGVEVHGERRFHGVVPFGQRDDGRQHVAEEVFHAFGRLVVVFEQMEAVLVLHTFDEGGG